MEIIPTVGAPAGPERNYRNAPDSRSDARHGARHALGMDDPTDDDVFLDAVDAVVLDALARIGDDPRARFAFFKRLLAVARIQRDLRH